MKRLYPAIIALLVTCITLLNLSACVKVRNPEEFKGPARLSEVATAVAITDEGKPLNTVTIFIASTPTIYVSAKVNNAPKDTEISTKWIYVKDSNGKEVNDTLYSDSDTVAGNRYVTFNHSAPGSEWQKGQYSIQLFIDGNEVTDANFTVKDLKAEDVPAPTITYFKAEPEAINFGQAVTLSWKTTDATKLMVTPSVGKVEATGNAIVKPYNTSEYTLTATNDIGTTTKKVVVEVTSFTSDRPELVITDFWVEGNKALYKISNIGGAESKESITGIYINGVSAGQSKVELLAPGQERTYSFPNLPWTYGTARIYKIPVRVCADDYNRVGEYDENNNCLVLDW